MVPGSGLAVELLPGPASLGVGEDSRVVHWDHSERASGNDGAD